MKISEDSKRFIPSARLNQIQGQTPLWEVFKQLRSGGFLVQTDEGLIKYVKAKELAEAFLNIVKNRGQGRLGAERVSVFLSNPEAESAIVTVEPRPIKSDEDPTPYEKGIETIFPVVEGNSAIGWFFSQEQSSRASQTSPPRYICTNGHSNPDPDDGSCYYCPADITVK